MDQEEIPELLPLGGPRAGRRPAAATRHACSRTPLRALRLLLLLVFLPTFFVCLPVYMRYRVYSGQMYPMGMTDMRLIDSKISTTWCQRQNVRSNATFNAFVLSEAPQLSDRLVPVSMSRQLELEDDMKEYWGFYLLQGSSVTVSACVRWPGASLIMIKGYKHLQQCAYIGDDSSEELDELLEAHKLGLLSNTSLVERLLQLKKEDGPANVPDAMRRQKGGVRFHHPSMDANATSSDAMPSADVTDHDPKELKEILEKLHAIREAAKQEAQKKYRPPDHLVALPALHRHRDANVDRDERRWLSFKDLDGNKTLDDMSPNESDITLKGTGTGVRITEEDKNLDSFEKDGYDQAYNKEDGLKNEMEVQAKKLTSADTFSDITIPIEHTPRTFKEHASNIQQNLNNKTEKEQQVVVDYKDNSEVEADQSSRELYEDVLKKLRAFGDRGHRVLQRLQDAMGNKTYDLHTVRAQELATLPPTPVSETESKLQQLDRLSRILIEAIDEEKNKQERNKKRYEAAASSIKVKRQLSLGAQSLAQELNQDDEARDFAAEEEQEADGFAEHHSRVNETTGPLDMSNSEFWSSFSSSEEALLECEGLVLNLPLTPHAACRRRTSALDVAYAAQRNALTYRVPANGYYFFVFNSENEVQTNFISVRFELQKTIYDVTRTALRACTNSTDRCDLPLDLFSKQKVVLEVPLRENDSLWNEQFVVLSECEPRTSVYLACVIAVPLLIMIFAFQ